MNIGRTVLSTLCLTLVVGAAMLAPSASAHMSPCHSKHTCPSDHHSYRYGPAKLLCTSVKSERRKADTVSIVVKGRRYWCSKPAPAVPAGSAAEAEAAVRKATTERFYPGQGKPTWQSFTRLECVGGKGVYQCSFGEGFAGTATVTWTASGPVVKFTSVSCDKAPALKTIRPEGCVLP